MKKEKKKSQIERHKFANLYKLGGKKNKSWLGKVLNLRKPEKILLFSYLVGH